MKPDYSRCYGITHDATSGLPIVREPKLLKVSIGAPKGKAIVVWTQREDSGSIAWRIQVGAKKGEQKVYKYGTRAEAEKAYAQLVQQAPDAAFPRKLGFFTFSRPTADGIMEPDFGAIEAHDPMPTELDVVFLSDDPFDAAYAMWSTAELRCKGDGINAERILSMASTPAEKQLAAEAQASGEKYFPIANGCWMRGCQYAKEVTKGDKTYPSPCKPSGDLKFQLANNLRVGGTAYFHTTGFRSISQIFSSLMVFRTLTGGGDPQRGYLAGIPFRMVCRPYQTKHNGQAATQYGVSLEFRAETVAALKHKLIEQASQFRDAFVGGPRAISAPAPMLESGMSFDSDEDEPVQAATMAAEFYPEADADADVTPTAAPAAKVAEVTSAKTTDLREKIQRAKQSHVVAEAPVTASSTEPTPSPVAPAKPAQAAVAEKQVPTTTVEEGDFF